MTFCLRVDLDYVPWDSPDAADFGHGEPAMLLRLLEMASAVEQRLHFFISNRVLRAFPAEAEAVLNRGHDLDWFCKHPSRMRPRYEAARELFEVLGSPMRGLCIRGVWPATVEAVPPEIEFVSSLPGPVPSGVKHFPVETRTDRDAARGGIGSRKWTDTVKGQLREAASRNRGVVVVVRPQVLAKFDPKLTQVHEMIEFARAIGLQPKTLRELL